MKNLNITDYELSLLLIAVQHWQAIIKSAAIKQNDNDLLSASDTLTELLNKIVALK